MTRGDERPPTAGRIDHVIFGNVHELGVRPVAWSFDRQDDVEWTGKNLDRFVRLENFLEQTPPATAFSYVRFRGDMVAVIRRHDDGTGSQGRNRADILIGHQDDLEPRTALGLEGLTQIWDVGVAPGHLLHAVHAQVLVDQAKRELPVLNGHRTDVRDHARQVLAAMGTYKDKRMLLVGMPEELKKTLLLVVEDVRRRHPEIFGEVGLTFSTYEAHSQDGQQAPGFVFVPDYPPTGTRRVAVDLTLSGRSKHPPLPEMLARADEALDSLLDDRPAPWLAGATSAGSAQRPELVSAGGGRATHAPPVDPPRGSGPLSLNYAGATGGDAPSYRGEQGTGGPEPDGPSAGRPRTTTHRWIDDLLNARTPDEFKSAYERMMREQPDPNGRRAALTPSTTLLEVYRRGVDVIAASGGGQDTALDQVLALAFGNDHAGLGTPAGAEYLFELVRATARYPSDDRARVKNLMAEVVQEYRSLPTGSATLQRVLADDYFESLGLEPLTSRTPTVSSPVPGPSHRLGDWLSRLTAGVRGSHPSGGEQRTVAPRNGVPAASSTWSTFAREERNGPSVATIVAVLAFLVIAVLIAFVVLQARNAATPAPVPPSTPTTAPSAGTSPSAAAPSTDSAAGSLTQPVKVQVADLEPTVRAALPRDAEGQPEKVVYVVWRGTSTGTIAFGEQCEPDWSTGAPAAYVCPAQSRPAGADATGEIIVVVSARALFDQKGGAAAEGHNSAGLVVGMTPLSRPMPY